MGRHRLWFPLVLLGFLMLGGLVVADARSRSAAQLWPLWQNAKPLAPDSNTVVVIGFGSTSMTMQPEEYWSIGLAVVFLATLVWYALGSGRVRDSVLIGLSGLVGLLLFYLTMAMVHGDPDLGPTIGGSLLAIGAAAGAWVYFRLGPGQLGVTAISVVCLSIGASALVIGHVPLFAEHMIVLSGLVALAVRERSPLLAVVAALFLAVAWLYPFGATGLALTAVVLFLGGAAAILTARRGQWAGEHTE